MDNQGNQEFLEWLNEFEQLNHKELRMLQNYCYYMLGYRIDGVRPCTWLMGLFDDWMEWRSDVSHNHNS